VQVTVTTEETTRDTYTLAAKPLRPDPIYVGGDSAYLNPLMRPNRRTLGLGDVRRVRSYDLPHDRHTASRHPSGPATAGPLLSLDTHTAGL
jgi:hypothetical protein